MGARRGGRSRCLPHSLPLETYLNVNDALDFFLTFGMLSLTANKTFAWFES